MADEILGLEARLKDYISTNINRIENEITEFGNKANTAFEKANRGGKGFMDTVKGFVTAQAIISGARMAWTKLNQVANESVTAYRGQVEASAKLNSALRSTGNAVGMTTDELENLAKQMQETTTFGDGLVMNGEAVMLTFTKIGREVFPQAIEAAADMSTMFGQDLQQSMIQLGTALNDPIQGVGRLRRIGVSFTETQKQQIEKFMEANDIMSAQNVILKELQNEFGGVAKAMAETDIGKLDQMENKLNDIQERIGQGVLPYLVQWKELQLEILNGAIRVWEEISGKTSRQEAKDKAAIENVNRLKEEISALEAQLTNLQPGQEFVTWMNDIGEMRVENIMVAAAELAILKEQIKGVNEEVNKTGKKTTPTAYTPPTVEGKAKGDIYEDILGSSEEMDRMAERNEEFFEMLSDAAERENEVARERLEARAQLEQDYRNIGKTEEQIAIEDRLIYLKWAYNQDLLNQKEYLALKNEVEIEANKISVQTMQNEVMAKIKIAKSGLSMMRSITNLALADTKEAANIMKGIAVAEAMVNIYQAATEAFQSGWKAGATVYDKAALAAGFMAEALAIGVGLVSTMKAQKFAMGTDRAPGGMALVGEHGPELINLPRGSQVFQAGESRHIMNTNNTTNNTGGNKVTINITTEVAATKLVNSLRNGELDGFVGDLKDQLLTLN